jgi:hypothetical protein
MFNETTVGAIDLPTNSPKVDQVVITPDDEGEYYIALYAMSLVFSLDLVVSLLLLIAYEK